MYKIHVHDFMAADADTMTEETSKDESTHRERRAGGDERESQAVSRADGGRAAERSNDVIGYSARRCEPRGSQCAPQMFIPDMFSQFLGMTLAPYRYRRNRKLYRSTPRPSRT